MSAIDALLAANERYAAGLPESSRPLPTGGRLAIVTCMDARIETGRAFGLNAGDAYVMRNGGGRLASSLPSLIVSQEMLGTDEVAIIHHTDCGMMSFADQDLRQRIASKGTGADALVFGTFTDLEGSVREDLELYAQSPFLRHDIPVRGFIFDVATGRLREVV
jgi:carbonic anhydrase